MVTISGSSSWLANNVHPKYDLDQEENCDVHEEERVAYISGNLLLNANEIQGSALQHDE
eukprot:CAMPEP_0170184330 /NCGR_PEP_ID=MMETSP0040_2-20121228/33367_1 /TAXON_ID=641309 /ORGANISM="Lotharella oceanica, Strain CCMP622" /LENGTH=58 /DNA_ID=CAMNT_0010430365 /DNA_START=134 /DNA_END=306 /DNA_ORIENTATION=-